MKIIDYKNEITTICKKYNVESLSVFGSVLTDRFNDSSDIDFLVVFRNRKIAGSFDRFFDLKEELENILSHNVDLVCENQIKNPYFEDRINQTKKVIYAA